MDDSIKDVYLKGRDKLPKEQQDYLIFNAISRLAGKDTLRNVAASLRRLDEWVSGPFTKHHGFQIDTAVVAWFLSEMSIGEDEHVPQQLVTGLRTAATELHFPIGVHETIIRHIAKPPTRTPKQAPSSSVRVFYHFWQIADSMGLSIPLRAMAGAFAVMCVSALRGIDAQRSSFDMKHRARNGYEFFSSVAWNSKNKQGMPWACPTVLFGSSDRWHEPLATIWGSKDFMFPTMERGRSLAEASSMGVEPTSNYMILRYLREILALPPALDERRISEAASPSFLSTFYS